MKIKKNSKKSGVVAILFIRLGQKIFPEKFFKREIFPANLKDLAKIIKELEYLLPRHLLQQNRVKSIVSTRSILGILLQSL